MKYTYTAIIKKESEDYYSCSVPDLPGCVTGGNSFDDAINMKTDATSLWLIVNEDEKNPIAPPQDVHDIPDNASTVKRNIDTDAYRKIM